jgi:aspartyl-tRNA(Asn)/glutamyl-tRNA(Gln) amidotransferase subunit A
LHEVAEREGGMSAVDFLGAEALRTEAAHAMARFHLKYDLVLCPTTPTAAFAADAPTLKPTEALWRDWAPWTFAFNLTRQPAITVPFGLDEHGMPRGVQLAAAQLRDDLCFRAARVIEQAVAIPVASPGSTADAQGCGHHHH